MSDIRYYADEQVSKAVIRGLRQRGIDVLSTPEAGNDHATDEVQLAFSTSEQRVLFTQDNDFLMLAAHGLKHTGIVYASQRFTIGRIILGLLDVHREFSAESMVDAVKYLKR